MSFKFRKRAPSLRVIRTAAFLALAGAVFSAPVVAGGASGFLCNRGETCHAKGLYTKKSAGPTKKDSVRLNPAQVPVEKVTGIETIYYRSSFDFGLVKGLGRVGAALSPSNSEETFFGPPASEVPVDFFTRMDQKNKYSAQKYTLAGAVTLYSKEGSGLDHRNISFGVMARYNGETQHITPGAGLLLILGPVSVGGALYEDERKVDVAPDGSSLFEPTAVATLTAGLALESVSFDYSLMTIGSSDPATANVFTITGFIDRTILTASRREVISEKPAFDFERNVLVTQPRKVEWFGGVQQRVAPWLVVGVFYNYYLLREGSLGATVFF